MTRHLFAWLGWTAALGMMSGCYTPLQVSQTTFTPPTARTNTTSPSSHATKTIADTQIVRLLLTRNPRIRSLRSAAKLQAQQHKRIGVVANPEFRVSQLSTALPETGAGGLTLQLRWSPPFPSEAKAKQSREKARSQVFAHQARSTINNMIAAAQSLHAKLVANTREQDTQRQLQALKQSRWKLAQQRSKMGTSTHLKVELTRLAYTEAQQQLNTLKQQRNQHLSQLLTALQLPNGSDIKTPPTWLDTLPAIPAFVPILTQTLQRSPALHQLVAKRQMAHASLWLANRKRVPWFSFVQFSYDFDKEQLPNRFFLSLGIDRPIFDFNTGNIHAERQTLQHLKRQIRATKQSITRRVRHVHTQLVQLQQAASQQKKTLTTRIKTSLQRAAKARRQGGTNLSEVLDIQSYAIRFQRTYTRTLLQYHLQHIDLQRLASSHSFAL
jgi:outer membrane protein TolC